MNSAVSAKGWGGLFPLVGRAAEQELLRAALERTEAGSGGVLILAGEGGVGKSRLANLAGAEARRRGWLVAAGRAFPAESGVPYSPFSDALTPVVQSLDTASLEVITRGGVAELYQLFPALGVHDSRRPPAESVRDTSTTVSDPAEYRIRLLWNLVQFLGRLAARQPLLLVLDDIHWADASSLELLHFLARQIRELRILVLCTYNEAERERAPGWRATEQSLLALNLASVRRVEPWSAAETHELVGRVFDAPESATREFARLLFDWTRGNPFFVEETLKSLVVSGKLRFAEGRWSGWDTGLELPASVREAVLQRIGGLAPADRKVAELVSVLGTRARYSVLQRVTGLAESDLLESLDELRRGRFLLERGDRDDVVYDLTHPLIRETLYAELGLARARQLHGEVARALEELHGPRALEHAEELALHFSRAEGRSGGSKAATYLAAAGRRALARYADQEAANYLSAALDQLERAGGDADEIDRLVQDLARARQRLGEYDVSLGLWERALEAARASGDPARIASVQRRLGLAHFWAGRGERALEYLDAALALLADTDQPGLEARLRLARGECLLSLARSGEALAEGEAALACAERSGELALVGRTHRSLLFHYAWTCNPGAARAHGAQAIALADELGDRAAGAMAHWAMTVVEGLTGNGEAAAGHIAASERLAEELGSPLPRLRTAEMALEYASATGEWDRALELAGRTIGLARSLNQRPLLARLLVWAALIRFARGEIEEGKQQVDEAWALAGVAAGRHATAQDVATVVPAHTGRLAYHMAIGEYEEAIRIGEAGMALADRTGYLVWGVHRLLPSLVESCLWIRDLDRAERLGKRLRHDSERLGHKLGLAWADACDAVVTWLRGDSERGAILLREAAEKLEAIPFLPDATRLRRQLAGRLAEIGDREGALRELRLVHQTLVRLGAMPELEKTRDMMRELGARPPVRASTSGAAGLTGRELEIVRLVAERRSNKAIGKTLGISPRTVSTHLTTIFRKLEVSSRGELTDVARQLAAEHGGLGRE
jgi:DNA-binding CsgD family transcriptional regulator/tetratricopeptide (TPR) repeat protein